MWRFAAHYGDHVAQRPDGRRPSVLLADDDDRFRSIVRSVLEDDGFPVVAEAADAATTIAMARAHNPDVVVLDLVMTGSVGLSTARALLADAPERPVLVISSLFDPVIEQEAISLGAWYLEKAEGVDALEHAIESMASVARRSV